MPAFTERVHTPCVCHCESERRSTKVGKIGNTVAHLEILLKDDVGRSRHTSKLEDKVDSLFTLLAESQPHLRQAGAFSNNTPAVDATSLPTRHQSSATDTCISPIQANILPTPEASTPALSARIDSSPCTIWDDVDEAESLEFLNDYRLNLVQEFPFVVVPSQWSPKHCAKAKPMLWKAILTSASYSDLNRQLRMGQRLTEELCNSLLIR